MGGQWISRPSHPPRQRPKTSGSSDGSLGNGVDCGDALPARSNRARRLRLAGAGAALVLILGGCASSPEASRVPGEPGADPGNHGNPVQLLEPPDRVERVYYDVPYDGPEAASEDTSQS